MSSPLDRNLTELLRRHEPVALDAGFRERLGARVRDEAARLAAARRSARAPAPRAARPAWIPILAAAASLAALLVAGWALWGGPPAAPSLRDILAQAGAAERAGPAADWHAPDAALSLQDGYLEAASAGRASLSIDLPQLGSVELPAGMAEGVEYLHASLQRRAAGPTRVRLLRGSGIAHLPFGDVPLPQGCDLVLDHDAVHTFSLPDAGPAPSLPTAPDAVPTSLVPGEPAIAVAPQPARLIGRIHLPGDALPVPESRLILVQSDITAAGPRQYVHTLPAGDGQFDWPDLPHGRFHLFVQVPGFAANITRHISIDSTLVLPPLDIRLDQGRTLRGRVVDGDTGAPVAGAVVLSDSDAPAVLLGLVEGALFGQYIPMTHTDEAGLFELRHLRAGVQVLRATHAGRAPAFGELAADVGKVSVDEPPKSADGARKSADGEKASADGVGEVAEAVDVELRLPAGGAVAGEVRRDDGTLWSGAQIVASFVNPLPSGRCMSYGYGITDEQGQYRMDDLPAMEGMVLLVGPQEAERRIPPMEAVSVPAGGMVRVNFGPQVPAGNEGTLVGYLAEADGSPAGGRMVSVLSEAWEASGHFETSMVDEQGNWHIEKLPADTYHVYVVFDVQYGVVTRVAQVDVPALGEARCSVQLAAGSLAGHILSPDGAPLPRTDLVVLERQATGTWDFVAHIVADDAGAWECPALAPGMYRAIGLDRKGAFAAARSEPVLVGTGKVDGVTVQLTLGGSLLVHVAAADGTPAARAVIRLRDARGEEWNLVQIQLTGPDGSLTLQGVPAGMWDVEAVPAAGGSIRTSVEVRVGEAAKADLVLPR